MSYFRRHLFRAKAVPRRRPHGEAERQEYQDLGLTKAGEPKPVPRTPHQGLRDLASSYMQQKGMAPHADTETTVRANPDRARRIADAYHAMPHDPSHPDVQRAYKALADETLDQYRHIKAAGYRFTPIKPGQENPYAAGSKAMLEDLHNNKHLYYYPTDQGFGSSNHDSSDHPLMADSGEKAADGKPMLHNDVFRVVHDVFGHGKEGFSFGPHGEENAWLHHMQMYSPDARRALTSETRGQNSWVNFGPYGEQNRKDPANTVYADQKAGLLPDWVLEDHDAAQKKSELAKGSLQRRTPYNPKDVPEEHQAPVSRWTESGYDGGRTEEDRQAIPRMEGNLRTRAIHKLHGLTQARRNPKTGEREFLLHRGMREEEHGRHVKGQHATYAGNMTWSANPEIAYDFGSEGNWPTKEGYKPRIHRVSAWVPESKIHHVPMMLGQLGGDLKRLGGGKLQRRDEHEVISAPGQYEVHSVSPIEPQKPQGLDDYKPRPFGKSEYFRSLKKGAKGDWKKEGYTIQHRREVQNPGTPDERVHYHLSAYDRHGNNVGSTLLSDYGGGLVPFHTEIDPDHRRKGLATALYTHAEKVAGIPVEPADEQSDDAESLWSQPNRPFGKSEYFRSLKKGLKGDWKKEGYKISVRPIQTNDLGLKSVFVDAHDKHGNQVGHVGFTQNWANANAAAPGRDMVAGRVEVKPEHRRKGIASAMYDAAHKASKLKPVPDDKGHQSDMGQKFWAARKAKLRSKTKKSEGLQKPAPYLQEDYEEGTLGDIEMGRRETGLKLHSKRMLPNGLEHRVYVDPGSEGDAEQTYHHEIHTPGNKGLPLSYVKVTTNIPSEWDGDADEDGNPYTRPEVTYSHVNPKHKGKGLGKIAYAAALEHHRQLYSDTLTSPMAEKVWRQIAQHVPTEIAPYGEEHEYDRHSATWVNGPSSRKLYHKVNLKGMAATRLKPKKPKMKGKRLAASALEKGSWQSKNPIPNSEFDQQNVPNSLTEWVRGAKQYDRQEIPKSKGPERLRSLSRLAAATQVRKNPKTGEHEFLLHRGHGPLDPAVGGDPSRTSWTPKLSLAHKFAAYGRHQKGTGTVTSAWIPASKIVSVPKHSGRRAVWETGYGSEHEVVVAPHKYQVHKQRYAGQIPMAELVDQKKPDLQARFKAYMEAKRPKKLAASELAKAPLDDDQMGWAEGWSEGFDGAGRDNLHETLMHPRHAEDRKKMLDGLAQRAKHKVINGERHFLLHRGHSEDEQPDYQSEVASWSTRKEVADAFADQYGGKTTSEWVPERHISYSFDDAHLTAPAGTKKPVRSLGAEAEVIAGPDHESYRLGHTRSFLPPEYQQPVTKPKKSLASLKPKKGKRIAASELIKAPYDAFDDEDHQERWETQQSLTPTGKGAEPERVQIRSEKVGELHGEDLYHHHIRHDADRHQHMLSKNPDPWGQAISILEGQNAGSGIQVLSSLTHGDYRGMGLGTQLYGHVARHHGRIISDHSLSGGSDAVYRKLKDSPYFKVKLGRKGAREPHVVEYVGDGNGDKDREVRKPRKKSLAALSKKLAASELTKRSELEKDIGGLKFKGYPKVSTRPQEEVREINPKTKRLQSAVLRNKVVQDVKSMSPRPMTPPPDYDQQLTLNARAMARPVVRHHIDEAGAGAGVTIQAEANTAGGRKFGRPFAIYHPATDVHEGNAQPHEAIHYQLRDLREKYGNHAYQDAVKQLASLHHPDDYSALAQWMKESGAATPENVDEEMVAYADTIARNPAYAREMGINVDHKRVKANFRRMQQLSRRLKPYAKSERSPFKKPELAKAAPKLPKLPKPKVEPVPSDARTNPRFQNFKQVPGRAVGVKGPNAGRSFHLFDAPHDPDQKILAQKTGGPVAFNDFGARSTKAIFNDRFNRVVGPKTAKRIAAGKQSAPVHEMFVATQPVGSKLRERNSSQPRVIDGNKHSHPRIGKKPGRKSLHHGIDLSNGQVLNTGSITDSEGKYLGRHKNHKKQDVFVKEGLDPESLADMGFQNPQLSTAHREAIYHNMAHDFFGLGQHVPQTTTFTHDGKHYSAMEWKGDHKPHGWDYGGKTPQSAHLKEMLKTGELHKVALMNLIMGNTDRHSGNFLTKKGKLALIDNGFTLDYNNDQGRDFQAAYLPSRNMPGGYEATAVPEHVRQWLHKLSPVKLASQLRANGVDAETVKAAVQRLQQVKELSHDHESVFDIADRIHGND